jgi:hypothetical protein
MSRKKIIIQSFLLAFIVSFFTIFMLFPETKEIAYTNISNWTINVSSTFLLKVVVILLWQTSALGSVFYVLAKKIFIK